MALIEVNPNMPQEQLIAAINQNFQEIQQRLYVTMIFKDETGTPRILIGRQVGGFN